MNSFNHFNGGRIHNQCRQRHESYSAKILKQKDASAVRDLQQFVFQKLPNANLYHPLSETEIEELLGKSGIILGVFIEERLIAFQALWFPEEHPDNLGHDLGLPESEWSRVCHLEASAVHPDYRGNGLQKTIASSLMKQLQEEGKYRHICATTAPSNIPSILNKLSNGMLLLQIKQKYNGDLRSLFYKNLFEPTALNLNHSISMPLDNISAQMEWIDRGYAGLHWMKDGDQLHLIFYRINCNDVYEEGLAPDAP